MANTKLIDALVHLDKDTVLAQARGADFEAVQADLRAAMDQMLSAFEQRTRSLVEVRDASVITNEVLATLSAETGKEIAYMGKMIICTVMNDVHKAGKIMTADLLRSIGVDVTDIGEQVPPETIVEALKQSGAPVLGLSGLVSSCIEPMKLTVDAVRAAGLDTFITIGGGQASEDLRRYAKADAVSLDMVGCARILQKFFAK